MLRDRFESSTSTANGNTALMTKRKERHVQLYELPTIHYSSSILLHILISGGTIDVDAMYLVLNSMNLRKKNIKK